MTTDEEREIILDAIFKSISDPLAICKIVDSENGDGGRDLVYVRVNDAYEKINHMKREDLVGKLYSSVWKNDIEDWGRVMISVAKTGSTGYGTVYGSDAHSGFFEAESSVAPGFYQLFIFCPVAGWVVLIFRDMAPWRKVALQLKKNEQQLRKLTAGLTLAEEKTRRAIASKLHDSIGYSMVTMLHTLTGLCEAMSGGEEKNKVAVAVEQMKKLIQDIRSFTFDISPPTLYEVGLAAAVESRCEHLRDTYGIACTFREEGCESGADEDIKILLYQMTHELLVNVVKHAKATSLLVVVRWKAQKVQIIVEDNGTGFTPGKIGRMNSGMGLFSIKERLRSVGGEMKIVSTGKGTTVSLLAPLHHQE